MGLIRSLFNFLLEDSKEPSGNDKMYKVRIRGTINANGPKTINRIVEMDEAQMRLFTGSKRYEAIEGWIKANYPGAKISSIRGFTAQRVYDK